MENYKMLIEFIRKEKTKDGAIGVTEHADILFKISKLGRDLGYNCYAKGYPASVSNYTPTNKEYKIKTLEDIALLNKEQFEMFVEDLRNWCNIQRKIVALQNAGIEVATEAGITRLDTGEHESIIDIRATSTNKL